MCPYKTNSYFELKPPPGGKPSISSLIVCMTYGKSTSRTSTSAKISEDKKHYSLYFCRILITFGYHLEKKIGIKYN